MKHFKWTCPLLLSGLVLISSCKKGGIGTEERGASQKYVLSYGTEVLYLKDGLKEQRAFPTGRKQGTYTSFPQGLELDKKTGVIDLAKSETGLRYLVTYTSEKGQTSNTTVVVSGINYPDNYFNLAQGDSIVKPFYNSNAANLPPCSGGGCGFDETGEARRSGCAVSAENGEINLNRTVANGLFGKTPKNGATADVVLNYRLNDGSGKALNQLKVRLYYYTSRKEVPNYLTELLQERRPMFLLAGETSLSAAARNADAKPRPPCVIVLAAE